jgi:hypothetical protein
MNCWAFSYFLIKEKIVLQKKVAVLQVDVKKQRSFTMKLDSEITINADSYLNKIDTGRWEKIRTSFEYRLDHDTTLKKKYNESQLSRFRNVLNNWEIYKKENKVNWYIHHTELEKGFYEYAIDDPLVKACWGYIILDQGTFNRPNFQRNIDALKTSFSQLAIASAVEYFESLQKGPFGQDYLEKLIDSKTLGIIKTQCPCINSQ